MHLCLHTLLFTSPTAGITCCLQANRQIVWLAADPIPTNTQSINQSIS